MNERERHRSDGGPASADGTDAGRGAVSVPLWAVSIPTLHQEEGRSVTGTHTLVVRAAHRQEARRVALDRAMERDALRHRKDALLLVHRLAVHPWKENA